MDGILTRREFVRAAVVGGAGLAIGTTMGFGIASLLRPTPTQLEAPIMLARDGPDIQMTAADLAGETRFQLGTYAFLPALVVKVPVASLRASAKARGYNTGQYALLHPEEPDKAIVAYQGKCTHLGCTVGFSTALGASKDIEDYDGDGKVEGRVLCPCHQAQFDVLDLAKNVPGTPGPRPLPVLRIAFRDEGASPVLYGLETIAQPSYRSADRQGDGTPFALAK